MISLNIQYILFDIGRYCKVVRDKTTLESKGIAYVKYDKASSAAMAIEGLNGKKLLQDQPALKVRPLLLFLYLIP